MKLLTKHSRQFRRQSLYSCCSVFRSEGDIHWHPGTRHSFFSGGVFFSGDVLVLIYRIYDVSNDHANTWARAGGGGSNRRRASPGDVAMGVLYADEAAVVSRSSEKLRNMKVIMAVCAASGIITVVSERSARLRSIICLRTKGISESITIFSVPLNDMEACHVVVTAYLVIFDKPMLLPLFFLVDAGP